MIRTFIIPQIDVPNVVQFINESYAKLKSLSKPGASRHNSFIDVSTSFVKSIILQDCDREEEAWYELLDSCINFMADGDLISILKQQKTQHQVPKVYLFQLNSL